MRDVTLAKEVSEKGFAMITTDFVPGSPCWLDLGVPDGTAAARFYGAVFGWEIEPWGTESPEAEGYGFLKLNGRTVGGLGPLTEEGARPAWMIYFHTPDVEATAEAVRRLGGTVRMDPMDVDDAGRMAQFTDPQGGEFAVWQPGKMPGLEVVSEPGSLAWTELYTSDTDAATAFYGELFGWTTSVHPLPAGDGPYLMVTPPGVEDDRMHGGMMQLPPEHLTRNGGRAYWHPVFESTDCDATVAKVAEHGGRVVMGPEDAEMVGRLAVVLDPFGADFVVLTPEG